MLFLFFAITTFALPPEAKDQIYDEFEGIKLAEALHRDGKNNAALEVLKSLSPKENSSSEAKRIIGDIQLAEGNPAQAEKSFQSALASANETQTPALYERLAQARSRLNKKPSCARAASAAGDRMYSSEGTILLKARCEWETNAAWSTLQRGAETIPAFSLTLEKTKFLLSRKLFVAAYELAYSRIQSPLSSSEILQLAEIFAQLGRQEEAMKLLELGKLRYPMDSDISLALAPLYHQRGWVHATLSAFERASLKDAKYAEHSAELNRQLGARHRAQMFQPLIPGEKERVRQRLALAVETSRWELVSSLDSTVKRAGLQNDDEVNYAMAFSLARIGSLERSSGYLQRIRSSGLLVKTAALRKILDGCEANPAECRF